MQVFGVAVGIVYGIIICNSFVYGWNDETIGVLFCFALYGRIKSVFFRFYYQYCCSG